MIIIIKHLIIFKEVARVRSMSRAGENLFLSQPTISQKIQEIEQYYKIKLFQRCGKHLGISEEGTIFLEHANKVLMELEEIDQIFFHHRNHITLRIGTTLTIACTIAPKLFRNIQELDPTFNFQVYVDNTQSIEDKLAENKLDIAIVEGDTHNELLHYEPFIDDQLVLICSCDHPLAKIETLEPTHLAHQTFIMREKGSGTRAMLEQYLALHNLNYRIGWECHSFESTKQVVLENHGITLISKRLIENELKHHRLHILDLQDWNDYKFKRKFTLCYKKNKQWTNNLERFKQYVLSYQETLEKAKKNS